MTGRLSLWVNAILHPKETFAAEKANANWKDALVNNAAIPLLVGLIFAIIGLTYPQWLALNIEMASEVARYGILSLIIFPIQSLIIACVLAVIFIGILHLVSKLFGGTGKFIELFYLTSLAAPAIAVISEVLNAIRIQMGWVSTSPIKEVNPNLGFAGDLLALVPFIVSALYFIYALRESRGFTAGKSMLVIIAYSVVVLFILFAILTILAGLFLGSFLGGFFRPAFGI